MVDRGEREQMERQHIFVVNGSPVFLDLVRELLQGEDYNVTTTNFVPETYDQIAALQPSVLIVDLEVGKRAGWDLLERLQAEASTNDIPTVMVVTDPQLMERAQAHKTRFGIKHVLTMPFDTDELVNAIEDLVGAA